MEERGEGKVSFCQEMESWRKSDIGPPRPRAHHSYLMLYSVGEVNYADMNIFQDTTYKMSLYL